MTQPRSAFGASPSKGAPPEDRQSRIRGGRLILMVFALAASADPARAVLGAAVASVQQDQMRLSGTRTQSVRAYHQVHEIVMADGSRIREFVSPSGIVFAVSWDTHFKPDLQALLGTYHAEYDTEAREALRRPGIRRQMSFQHSDLVLESSGHLNHFSGRAWVPSLTPGGLAADAVR